MEDSRLLYDAFNIYYERGINSLKTNNYDMARRNFLAAAETLLKLAKESNGSLKTKRIKRAEELNELAEQIEEKIKEKNVSVLTDTNNEVKSAVNVSNASVNNADPVSIEKAISDLNALEGLKAVKEQVSDLVDQIKVFQMRKNQGLQTPEMSYHMVFTGNPGTGKTTVARIIGEIYQALGILSKGHLVEVDRSDLVAGYVGQTALKTKEVINKAMGGVLFIDEAYSLKKDGNDFGQEAIDTLNKTMEDSRADLVVIVAGYKDEIKTFIDSNQGLRSRFRTYINFNDYTGKELYNIFLGILKKNEYEITSEADSIVYQYLNNGNNIFKGNARDIRNLFENIIKLQSRRLAKIDKPTISEITTITKEDLPFSTKDYSYVSKTDFDDSVQNEEDSHEELSNDDNDSLKDDFDAIESEKEVKKKIACTSDSASDVNNSEYKFEWDLLPGIHFDDIAGLEAVKDVVRTKVLLPLKQPEAFDGYEKKNGGGLFLYGPPGTGKTMIAAAIANEIGAEFCSVKPSDLLHQGAGNTEKAVRSLFAQARRFPCSVIYFDEIDAIAQKNTRSSYSRQLRSELLAQMQGIDSYNKENGNIMFLIAATNKPWDVDSAFLRPGRFGTRIYVGLPDEETRKYIIRTRFDKIHEKGIVKIDDDIDIANMVGKTDGFNCSDIANLLDRIEELSAIRGVNTGYKHISEEDVDEALVEIHSSVQKADIEKLVAWNQQNNY